MTMRIRTASLRDDESGIALVTVIGITSVLAIIATVAIAFSINSLGFARDDQDWNAAVQAAYAGAEEYQSRITDDPSYVRYGNPNSTYTKASGSNVTMPPANLENPAFGLGVTGTWASVPQNAVQVGTSTAEFRYEVDTSKYVANGVISVRSTGRVGGVNGETRTIIAQLRQTGFIQYVYFSDFEFGDPSLDLETQASPSSDRAANQCTTYWHAGRSDVYASRNIFNPYPCQEIAFGGGDTLTGPVHSNDTIRICDATFEGAVTTTAPVTSGRAYLNRNSNYATCSGQDFEAGAPTTAAYIGMPASNADLKQEVRTDVTGVVPGCLYTGPTKITFNANGTVNIVSPWTKATRVAGDASTSGTTPSECGAIADLRKTAGATITVPKDNVIYVQDVPTATSNVNSWSATSAPSFNGSTLSCRGADNQANGNGIGFPTNNEVAPSASSYACRSGDAFVQGTVDGNVTVASERFVYVTGDILYKDKTDDVLGLIGNSAVWVWNPYRSNGNSLLSGNGREIDAAILSVQHTFAVQSIGSSRGVTNPTDNRNLTVFGSIAQKYRGVVSSGNYGYTKDYQYDERLLYQAPPKFLAPTNATYQISRYAETNPAMSASGAERD